MSGDVITTIHRYVKEYGIYVALFLAVVGAYYTWAGRWITWTFALRSKRKLRRLQARRKWLQQLHDCNRVYYGYLLSGVLWVLALLGFHLIMESVWILYPMVPLEQPGGQRELIMTARLGLGLGVFYFAVSRLSMYMFLLQNYKPAMGNLTRAIDTLEAKQAGHQPAAAA
jgi:hypothetical protein